MTFVTDASHIKVDGFFLPFMNCSFDFRTFNDEGLMLYNRFSSANGYVKAYLDRGKLTVGLQGTDTPPIILGRSCAVCLSVTDESSFQIRSLIVC